ncbi:MAG: UbiA family prenyltransferase [Candidatus Odinarchaeota archaeon]
MRTQALLLIRTSRPLGWLIAPLVFLLGLTAFGSPLSLITILQLILLTFPYCVLLYGTNDIFDYEADKLNPRKTVPDSPEMETQFFPLVRTLSFVVSIVLFASAVITFNLTNIIAMILLLFFSYFYSAPPLRFKERPPLDSFSNGIIYFFAPVLLGTSFGATLLDIPIQAYFITVCVMGIHSFSTVMDYSADKLAGDRTFAVVLRKRTASFFTVIVFTIAYFFSGFQGSVVGYFLIFCASLAGIITFVPSEKLAKYFFYSMGIGFSIVGVYEMLRYFAFFY